MEHHEHGTCADTSCEQCNKKSEIKWADFRVAVPLAALIMALFVGLQKIGLVNLIQPEGVTLGTAFVIGVVASFSTCMAVVGGLLLSMSSTFAREGDKVRPQLYFHGGRLVAFFVLGGVIGALGSAMQVTPTMSIVLGVLVGVVMLLLGLNLLNVFRPLKKYQIKMPSWISRKALEVERFNHSITPLLVGVATFFLPCGFTQAMQIYTLTTGSFFAGAMTMFVYALGTLPMLTLLSFSSLAVKTRKGGSIFFKTVGLVIIGFALINISTSLAAAGIIPPIINF